MANGPRINIVPGWRAWGSEFVRLQQAGHINVESGHGEWPLGLALLQSLGAATVPAVLPAMTR